MKSTITINQDDNLSSLRVIKTNTTINEQIDFIADNWKTNTSNKLNIIASMFENETGANFNECQSDSAFNKIILNTCNEDMQTINKKFVDYAHLNLI